MNVQQSEELPSWTDLVQKATIDRFGYRLPDNPNIYQPLHNENNKLLTWEALCSFFGKVWNVQATKDSCLWKLSSGEEISISRKNLPLFQRAFVHLSYSEERAKKQAKNVKDWDPPKIPKDCVPIQPSSNERLEWHGDSMVQSIIGTYLSTRYPQLEEGKLTIFRSKLVRTETLGNYGVYLGFKPWILMSKFQEENLKGREDLHLFEDAFEAFIGAFFQADKLSFSYQVVTEFIWTIMETVIDIPLFLNTDENFKDKLMQFYQKNYNGIFPTYSQRGTEDVTEEDGTVVKMNRIAVHEPNGAVLLDGIGRSKIDAEQNAAMKACQHYGIPIFQPGRAYYLTPMHTASV